LISGMVARGLGASRAGKKMDSATPPTGPSTQNRPKS
jgi:hypothetical protein